MGQNQKQRIVPVMLARHLHTIGGSPIAQSIPREYVLASIIVRAYKNRNGEDLEFVLKSYLPISLFPISETRRCFLIEQLGLQSTSVKRINSVDTDSIFKALSDASSLNDLRLIMKRIRMAHSELIPCDEIDLIGLLSGGIAEALSGILDWPCMDDIEHYSVVLPKPSLGTMKNPPAEEILRLAANLANARKMQTILDEFESHVHRALDGALRVSTKTLARLDSRIQRLESNIAHLESRILAADAQGRSNEMNALRRNLEKRRTALERDQEKRAQLQLSEDESSRALLVGIEEIRDLAKKTQDNLMDVSGIIESLLVDYGSLDQSSNPTEIMVPFYLLGFSKKGVLRVKVCGPSTLVDADQRIGVRRDFVDTLGIAADGLDLLRRLLEERIDQDVSLMKHLRESSVSSNMLSMTLTRELISSGMNLLVAEGLLKAGLRDEIAEFLDTIPVSEDIHMHDTDYQINEDESNLCKVRFHIHDSLGSPIAGALLLIAGMSFTSDGRGSIVVSLPISHYDAKISADGFRDKELEFALRKQGDIVIPISLLPLTHEEQVDRSLEKLIERAERLDGIRLRLLDAFEKHGDTLLNIPIYRSALVELLKELGYDPEPWISNAKRESGMVKRFLKRDDRYDMLKREILRFADESKAFGGFMLLSELITRLTNLGWAISLKELEDVIAEMIEDGLILGISETGEGAKLVEFIPVSLTADPQEVLRLAAEKDGLLTIEEVVISLGWTESRSVKALNLLVENGVAKIEQSFSKSTQYWFPGLRGKK